MKVHRLCGDIYLGDNIHISKGFYLTLRLGVGRVTQTLSYNVISFAYKYREKRGKVTLYETINKPFWRCQAWYSILTN